MIRNLKADSKKNLLDNQGIAEFFPAAANGRM
jgi:hypothetical protein